MNSPTTRGARYTISMVCTRDKVGTMGTYKPRSREAAKRRSGTEERRHMVTLIMKAQASKCFASVLQVQCTGFLAGFFLTYLNISSGETIGAFPPFFAAIALPALMYSVNFCIPGHGCSQRIYCGINPRTTSLPCRPFENKTVMPLHPL